MGLVCAPGWVGAYRDLIPPEGLGYHRAAGSPTSRWGWWPLSAMELCAVAAGRGGAQGGEGEGVSPSPASQERLATSQGAKTSPCLNTALGGCRQGILMGQNKWEGERAAPTPPWPVFTGRAPAPPAHADAPQPSRSTPPRAHPRPPGLHGD